MAEPKVDPGILAPGATLGGHEIVRQIGKGGMGTVYEAVQLSLRRRVALKLLSPRLAKRPRFAPRFARGPPSLANLGHPNIVAIYDRGVEGDLYYFTMEYVAGETLRRRLRKGRPAVGESRRILDEVLSALDHAHARGVIHRDIKPENVLLDPEGRVKVADFGIAHLVRSEETGESGGGPAPTTGRLTVGTIGTPDYMAPEQRRRGAPSDHRADLYAVGVVGCEMLIGRLPRNEAEALSQDVPRPLGRFLWRMLAPDPNDRFPNAAAARAALAQTADAAADAAVLPAVAAPTPAPGFPLAGKLALAGALFACVVGGILLGRSMANAPVPGPVAAANTDPAGGKANPPTNAGTGPSSTGGTTTGGSPSGTGPGSTGGTTGGSPSGTGQGSTGGTPGGSPSGTGQGSAGGSPAGTPGASSDAKPALAELDPRLKAALAQSAWSASRALLADFRTRHARALDGDPQQAEAFAERQRAFEEQARAQFQQRQDESAALRERGEYRAALAAIEHPGGYGTDRLDEAAQQVRVRTRQAAFDAGLARARRLRDSGKLRDAVAAYRSALEFTEEPAALVSVNGEIAALRRAARAELHEPLKKLALFVRNGRFELPYELRAVRADPERSDLAPFVKGVEEDLERFKSGQTKAGDVSAEWQMRLERTPLALGDREGLTAADRCERCEGKGGDACRACAEKGTVIGACPECAGRGTATCRKCDGKKEAECGDCLGKGFIVKYKRIKCDRCLPTKCGSCKGTGIGPGFGVCGGCRGTGWLGSAGRIGDRICPDCKGAKTIQLSDEIDCAACGKKGKKPCTVCRGAGTTKCGNCEATGKAPVACADCAGAGAAPCPRCKGSGRRAEK